MTWIQWGSPQIQDGFSTDEYAYGIPHLYTTLAHQGKGISTQDKQHVSWATSQSYAAAASTL